MDWAISIQATIYLRFMKQTVILNVYEYEGAGEMNYRPLNRDHMEGYFITEDGRVLSNKSGTIKELKQSEDTKGYMRISLNPRGLKGKKVNARIHNLVAEAYIGKKPEGLTVNHIDGNKLNNHYTNLEYITYRENNLHAYKLGLKKGVVHKLTDEDAYKLIELYNRGVEASVLAKTYNVTQHYVYQLVHGRRKGHIRAQYDKTIRTTKKLTNELCAQMIREVLNGADPHETAEKYAINTNYLHEIMRKEKRLNAWELIGIDTPTIPQNKLPAETVAQMIIEVQNGLPKVEAQKKYGVSRSQLFKILRKDFREDAWKIVEGSETIRKE